MHPCVDRVVIVSTASVGSLKKSLPLSVLKKGFHCFDILTYGGPDPRLRSSASISDGINAAISVCRPSQAPRYRRAICLVCPRSITRNGEVACR